MRIKLLVLLSFGNSFPHRLFKIGLHCCETSAVKFVNYALLDCCQTSLDFRVYFYFSLVFYCKIILLFISSISDYFNVCYMQILHSLAGFLFCQSYTVATFP